MEMTCKRCQKSVPEDQCQKVANWHFCKECFLIFLEESKKKESKTETPSYSFSTTFELKPPKPTCHSCDKELVGENFKALGDWKFCPECFSELMPNSPTKKEDPMLKKLQSIVPEDTEEPTTPTPPANTITPNAMLELAEAIKNLPSELAKKQEPKERLCKGCGRTLMQGGYKDVAGDAFCPDCYYAIIAVVGGDFQFQKPKVAPKIEAKPLSTLHGRGRAIVTPTFYSSPEESVSPAPNVSAPNVSAPNVSAPNVAAPNVSNASSGECQSCMRAVPASALKTVEGFFLCQACISTDINSALLIARKRHKKHLQKLQEELGMDDTESPDSPTC
jgi:formylmethanofuran dehydrogenase subunit E